MVNTDVRIALLYPPPWKLDASEQTDFGEHGAPDDYQSGDLDGDFLTDGETVEESSRRQPLDLVVGLDEFVELFEDSRIHEVAVKIVVVGGASELLAELFASGVEINRVSLFAEYNRVQFRNICGGRVNSIPKFSQREWIHIQHTRSISSRLIST